MTADESRARDDQLARIVDEAGRRLPGLSMDSEGVPHVCSELPSVDRVLARIREERLATGPVFCEWGSGMGGVCGVAAINGFTPLGIEIRGDLVIAARSFAKSLDLSMVFAEGSFLLPGDEDLALNANPNTRRSFDSSAWDEMDLAPKDCDVIFAYPWPGEEAFVDGVFSRHAAEDALLVTFHDFDRVLVQRKRDNEEALVLLDWM